MTVLIKMVQTLAKYKSLRLMKCYRNIHSNASTSQTQHENHYAYNILKNKGYVSNFNTNIPEPVLPEDQFKKLIEEDWSKKHPHALFDAFSKLAVYCSKNSICISNTMFDNFIDSLTDSLKLATDKELITIHSALINWPEVKSISTRNFIEVWVALDDQCLERSKNWSFDKQLQFVNLFHMLRMVRVSDYCLTCINKLSSIPKYLTASQLVQILFFVAVSRKQPLYMQNLEICLMERFSLFSVDELGIMAMGFFKSKTPIKNMYLLSKIIDTIVKNSQTIHEISLAAILKLVRYSANTIVNQRICTLLDTLQKEVPRLSVMCNVHLALLGSQTLNLHTGCLNKIADSLSNHMSQTRIKDLERLVLAYGTLNFIPQTKDCFFTRIINELRKPERASEIMEFGRSFSCCIAYLSLLGIYPVDLINQALSTELLAKSYGKSCYNYGMEILALHFATEIHNVSGVTNRLSEVEVRTLAKKYTNDVPSKVDKDKNIRDRIILEVIELIKEERGSSDYVIGLHILPYHQKRDIIICDDEFGEPVKIKDIFSLTDFGLRRRPHDGHMFTVLVIAGRNCLIYGTDKPTGPIISKVRDLEALGYSAGVVPWSIYTKLKTLDEKRVFINNIILKCRKINHYE